MRITTGLDKISIRKKHASDSIKGFVQLEEIANMIITVWFHLVANLGMEYIFVARGLQMKAVSTQVLLRFWRGKDQLINRNPLMLNSNRINFYTLNMFSMALFSLTFESFRFMLFMLNYIEYFLYRRKYTAIF